jgi:hypothetical protein
MYGMAGCYNFIVGEMAYAAEIVHVNKLMQEDTNTVLVTTLIMRQFEL